MTHPLGEEIPSFSSNSRVQSERHVVVISISTGAGVVKIKIVSASSFASPAPPIGP